MVLWFLVWSKNAKNFMLKNSKQWFLVWSRTKKAMISSVKLRWIKSSLFLWYSLKEEFLGIINHATNTNSSDQLIKWISKCVASNISEFIEAAGTIARWKEYIVNSFIDVRYSNGFTEGINNKIKVIKRVEFGYKSFKLFRARIMYIFNGKISGSIKHKNDSKVENK